MGIGEVLKQSFTNASFWVQLKNVPIMCMDMGTISELGVAIGRVEEVWIDVNGECTGEIIRLKISIDITKPLMTILSVEQEDGEKDDVPITINTKSCLIFVIVVAALVISTENAQSLKTKLKRSYCMGHGLKPQLWWIN